jgi:hypothetical protein
MPSQPPAIEAIPLIEAIHSYEKEDPSPDDPTYISAGIIEHSKRVMMARCGT